MYDEYILHKLEIIEPRQNEKIYTFIEGNYLFVKLVDIKQLNRIETIAFIALEQVKLEEEDGYQVKLTKSFQEGRGLMKYLFRFLLFELNETIYADDTHTIPGSMNFWKSLKSWENTVVELVNLITCTTEEYDQQFDYEIWGIDEGFTVNGIVETDLIERLREANIINENLYDFILTNQVNLTNRSDIALRIKNVTKD
jgi:hypothetical protein